MEIIKNLKLENNVIFLGHISEDEVKNLLRELDILVMPSIGEGEGLPYAVLEAMSFGIPVVGCNIGGIPELITNGVTGIIVPPRDVKKLAEALAKIINSPDLAYKLGLEGRIRFEKEFSFESMITKTENIFLDLINL
jgi:glycosyltransferase involved in cell wall biosynthesis